MEKILLSIDGSIATLTFNSPKTYNALDEALGEDFLKALDQVRNNKNIRVLILTGAGKAFSSGGNLDMLTEKTKRSAEVNERELKKFYQTFLEVRNLNIPVIAAINGPAVGAGFCLSLACDFRYASTDAKMGANFARLGLAPGMGGTFLITQVLGPTRASEVLLLGEVFDARKAFEYGLLNDVVTPDQLLPTAMATAKKLASNGPISLQYIKKGIQKALNSTLEEMFDYDSHHQALTFTTKDILEGIAAVREKRAPQFKGE